MATPDNCNHSSIRATLTPHQKPLVGSSHSFPHEVNLRKEIEKKAIDKLCYTAPTCWVYAESFAHGWEEKKGNVEQLKTEVNSVSVQPKTAQKGPTINQGKIYQFWVFKHHYRSTEQNWMRNPCENKKKSMEARRKISNLRLANGRSKLPGEQRSTYHLTLPPHHYVLLSLLSLANTPILIWC